MCVSLSFIFSFLLWSIFLSACHVRSAVHFQTISAYKHPPDFETYVEPPPPPQAAEDKTYAQPFPGETLQVMFPYSPPDVDNNINNNEVNTDENHGPSEEKTFIEMTVIPRSYTGLETHYSETPLSHVNPEDPPPNTYDATRITEGWEAGSKDAHSKDRSEPMWETGHHEAVGASGTPEPPSPSHEHHSEPNPRPPSPVEAPWAPSPSQVTPISISTNEHDISVSARFILVYSFLYHPFN